MSKPSKKTPPTPPPAAAGRGKAPLIIGIVTVAALAVGAFVVIQNNNQSSASTEVASAQPAAATAAAPGQPAAGQTAATPPPPAPAQVLKPHLTQKQFPPLALPAYPLGRSQDVIRAAYRFAAEHPEILTYVPCFCGCERSGHKGNEDCFVKARGANGDVTEWEPHGMECNVCIDVATQAMQMHSSGASVRDIRAAVEQKWAAQAAQSHAHTPTPEPPKN